MDFLRIKMMATFKTLKGMLDSSSPWVVAHRGDSRFCPENTMSAFRSAMEKGAEMIECDIHLSRDRVPVVCLNHILYNSLITN